MSRTASGTVEWRGTPARWWARLTVRTEDGKTKRVWVDLERPDLVNTMEDKRAAKRIAAKRARLASKKTFVGVERAAAPRVTLEDLEEKWFTLIEKDPDLKLATVSRLKSSWGAIVKSLGKRQVVDLTPPVLRSWVLQLRAETSVSSVRNNVNALTRVFKDAIAQRWVLLAVNPMRDDYLRSAVPPMQAPDAEEIVQWKRGEVETLLASDLSDLHFGMLLVSVTTGLRAGELHGLRFSDVGADDKAPDVKRVHVRRQAGLPRSGRPVEVGTPKSAAGKRKVPLHEATQAWLTWWKETGWTVYVGRPPEAEDYVFSDAAGAIWRPRGGDLIREVLAAAKMPEAFALPDGGTADFTWHATRRTFASLLADAGVGGELVDYLLGQSPHTTRGRHYQAPPMNELARAIATLRLALPERPGVASSAPQSPPQSSRESSQASEVPPATQHIDEQLQYLAPVAQRIEQRFPNSPSASTTEHAGEPEKQGESSKADALAILSNSAEQRHSKALVLQGRTIRDDSRGYPSDQTEAALARALDLAVDVGRIDLVDRILAQLEGRRRG